jgi:rubrerythrin
MDQKRAPRKSQESNSTRSKLPIGPLDFARNLEVKGATLYLKFAVESENLLTKQLFYSLAIEEVEHAKKIDEIYAALKENKGWQSAITEQLPSVETKLKTFFSRAAKVNLKSDKPGAVCYELAIEMEKSGFKAYTDFYNQAESEQEKTFYKELLKEEKGHLDALANVYYYLTDTADWLQEDESKVWNWMNL